LCVRVLAGIVAEKTVAPAARVTAAGLLLDRGWGKAVQPIAGEDREPLRVVIRHLTEAAEVDPVPTGLTAPLVIN
jgi:hypothetical protein